MGLTWLGLIGLKWFVSFTSERETRGCQAVRYLNRLVSETRAIREPERFWVLCKVTHLTFFLSDLGRIQFYSIMHVMYS